jgi:predicted NUDIX family NTP pyrophosphohydrolase
MPQRSAGILLYRLTPSGPEVLLVHPGGPFWAKKDEGAWSIPKGLYEPDEDPLAAARREFEEETGCTLPDRLVPLGDFKYASGKVVSAWAAEGDFDIERFRCNTFTMEWPPKSGRTAEFPEADRAAWFDVEEARRKIVKGQVPMIESLLGRLAEPALWLACRH